MAVTVTCGTCKTRLQVNETALGKKVRCPKCQAVFEAVSEGLSGGMPRQAPASTPSHSDGFQEGIPPRPPVIGGDFGASPQDNFDPYYDTPNIQGSSIGSWQSTITGLRLLLISVVTLLIVGFGIGLMQIILPIDPMVAMRGGNFGPAPLIQGLMMCVMLIMMIVGFVGACMCCTAPYPPAKKRALIGILLFIGCVVSSVVVGVVFATMAIGAAQQGGLQAGGNFNPNMFMAAGVTGLAMGVVVLALGIASFVMWMLFHVSIAEYFRVPSLRTLSMICLIVFLVMFFANFGVSIGLGIAFQGDFKTLSRFQGIWSIIYTSIQYGFYLAVVSKSLKAIQTGGEAA